MEYLFLIIGLVAFVALEAILDNIIWLGCIFIGIILITIIRAFRDYAEFGFDFGDFQILLIKLLVIAGVIWLMVVV